MQDLFASNDAPLTEFISLTSSFRSMSGPLTFSVGINDPVILDALCRLRAGVRRALDAGTEAVRLKEAESWVRVGCLEASSASGAVTAANQGSRRTARWTPDGAHRNSSASSTALDS